jgi:catechol 2,3-dioxygenase-like lactoylglutathione lyase family enzyme
MLDHIILTVSDIKRSLAFYEAALKPLNIKFFMPFKGEDGHPDLWGFGDGKKAFFWIKQGKPDPTAIHWGFVAENENKVDEFYEAAMSAGARDNISPRARENHNNYDRNQDQNEGVLHHALATLFAARLDRLDLNSPPFF